MLPEHEDDAPSLRDTLEAAIEADASGEPPAADPAPEPDPQEPAPEPDPAAIKHPDGDLPRDEQGRFAARKQPAQEQSQQEGPAPQQEQVAPQQEPAPQDPPAQPADPAAEPGPQPAMAPPGGWSVEAKAAFDSLPDAVKQAVAHREREVSEGFEMYGGLKKHVQYAQSINANLSDLVDSWRKAEQYLDHDPVAGVKWLMEAYGVRPEQIGAQPQVQQPQPQHSAPAQPGAVDQPAQATPQTVPQLQPVLEQLAAVNNRLGDFEAQQEQSRQLALQNEVNAFFADPVNKYAENVRGEMERILSAGLAGNLKEAYDQALWLNPETQKVMIAERAAQTAAGGQDQKKAEAEKKRNASVSVSGNAPDGGASPTPANGQTDNVRGALEAAFNQHAGGV